MRGVEMNCAVEGSGWDDCKEKLWNSGWAEGLGKECELRICYVRALILKGEMVCIMIPHHSEQ